MAEKQDITLSSLTINELTQSTYEQLSAAGQLQTNEVYVIKPTSRLNAHGMRGLNFGMPVVSSDAATKKYVDDELQKIDIGDKLSDVKYTLKTAELVPYGNGLCCQLSNYTITTIRIMTSSPLSVFLPAATDDESVRDFVIRFENTNTQNATVAFVPSGSEDIDYESSTDNWMDIEPGVNIISFTETKR